MKTILRQAAWVGCLLCSVVCATLQPAGAQTTLYVATPQSVPAGNDATGNGTASKPYATIAKAITIARSGDTIGLMDGAYPVSAALTLPAGVSLTSVHQDNTKVRLYPSANLAYTTPMISLSSPTPGSDGTQTLSYLELDGTEGSKVAQKAILVQNRNNVSIHHCAIHDFSTYSEDTAVSPYTIEVLSTQLNRTSNWWTYWPADSQAPGIDTNINALWPLHPVKNFQFYSNRVTRCHAIGPFHLKDSSFHHNTIDNSETWGWCFKGTCAFMDNVDLYDNELKAYRSDLVIPKSPWTVELWLHRNGCEYYNNVMTAGYSVTIGKETRVYGNTIVMDPPVAWDGKGFGIEFNGQSYSQVDTNYISGAATGITVGIDMCNGKNWLCEHTLTRNNVIVNSYYNGIRVKGYAPEDTAGYTSTSQHHYIYNNVVDGANKTAAGISLYQRPGAGNSLLKKIYVKNNIIVNIAGYAGATDGLVTDYEITHNQFYANSYNSWKNGTSSFTQTTNPLFIRLGVDYAGYALQASPVASPCINSGVNVNLPFNGSAPDRGAIETGSASPTPLAPRGLTVR